jgi:cytochrome b6-f complex iron-sulfur subunit
MSDPQGVKKPKQDRPPADDPGIWRMNRRHFLSTGGWWAFFVFIGIAVAGAVRGLVPRVLFEPPSSFRAGTPDQFPVGTVSEQYKESQRVWIVRDKEGFYALAAVCTHLGCTPRWIENEDKFKCPCHGSGFQRSGINYEGPAPRPLERLKISLASDGQIVIDRNVRFRFEDGGWSNPDSFLPFAG